MQEWHDEFTHEGSQNHRKSLLNEAKLLNFKQKYRNGTILN